MAKGNRQRSNKLSPGEAAITPKQPTDIKPLHMQEGQLIQQLVNISASYGKLLKQKLQYEFLSKSMNETRNKIQKGEITVLNVPVAPNTTAPLTDKKEMLVYIDEQIHLVKQSILAINGQLENKRDLFIENGLHLKDWCETRFGQYRTKEVSGYRGQAGSKNIEDEKVLFESEFDDLDLEAFKKAKAKAVELNKELEKKKEE